VPLCALLCAVCAHSFAFVAKAVRPTQSISAAGFARSAGALGKSWPATKTYTLKWPARNSQSQNGRQKDGLAPPTQQQQLKASEREGGASPNGKNISSNCSSSLLIDFIALFQQRNPAEHNGPLGAKCCCLGSLHDHQHGQSGPELSRSARKQLHQQTTACWVPFFGANSLLGLLSPTGDGPNKRPAKPLVHLIDINLPPSKLWPALTCRRHAGSKREHRGRPMGAFGALFWRLFGDGAQRVQCARDCVRQRLCTVQTVYVTLAHSVWPPRVAGAPVGSSLARTRRQSCAAAGQRREIMNYCQPLKISAKANWGPEEAQF